MLHNQLTMNVSRSDHLFNGAFVALKKRLVAMTTLHWRGIAYDREAQHDNYVQWWNLVHRATLWLCYRGIEYRPSALQPVPVYCKNK